MAEVGIVFSLATTEPEPLSVGVLLGEPFPAIGDVRIGRGLVDVADEGIGAEVENAPVVLELEGMP